MLTENERSKIANALGIQALITEEKINSVYQAAGIEPADLESILNDIQNGYLSIVSQEIYRSASEDETSVFCTDNVLWYYDGPHEGVVEV